jgi:LacI family transcriptional regulator
MAALLALDHPPAAVFAANDLMALGALEACHAEGVRVPADVAIAGYDDIEASRMVTPALTTVVQPQRLLGHDVGRLLLERLTGTPDAPVRETAIGLELAIRESA